MEVHREGQGQGRDSPGPAGQFTVTDSSHHGFVRIAPNQRYLIYNDGTSFYGVGMWYNDSYELFNGGEITEQDLDGLKETRRQLHQLLPHAAGDDGHGARQVR